VLDRANRSLRSRHVHTRASTREPQDSIWSCARFNYMPIVTNYKAEGVWLHKERNTVGDPVGDVFTETTGSYRTY